MSTTRLVVDVRAHVGEGPPVPVELAPDDDVPGRPADEADAPVAEAGQVAHGERRGVPVVARHERRRDVRRRTR